MNALMKRKNHFVASFLLLMAVFAGILVVALAPIGSTAFRITFTIFAIIVLIAAFKGSEAG